MKRIHALLPAAFFSFLFQTVFAQGAGSALQFAGGASSQCPSCNYVRIYDPATGELDIGSGNFTICLWMRTTALPTNYGIILSKEIGGNVNRAGYEIFLDAPDGDVVFQLWHANTFYPTSSRAPVSDGSWHHLAAVVNDSGMAFFIDGTLADRAIFGRLNIENGSALQFGLRPDLYFPFAGQIDEVSIFAAALDSSTIRDWMHQKITATHPNFNNLRGYWRIDESSGATVIDSSQRQNHGYLTNMDTTAAWRASTVPFVSVNLPQLYDLRAVWATKDSSTSSILTVKPDTLPGNTSLVFGHNNNALQFDSTLATQGYSTRLARVWWLEPQESPATRLFFDLHDVALTDSSKLRLLFADDSLFSNATAFDGEFADGMLKTDVFTFSTGVFATVAELGMPTAIAEQHDPAVPRRFYLFGNYPNPFNPETNIRFDLPQDVVVELTIYSVLGEKVAVLLNGHKAAGRYSLPFRADGLASGIYICFLRAGELQASSKMLLLR